MIATALLFYVCVLALSLALRLCPHRANEVAVKNFGAAGITACFCLAIYGVCNFVIVIIARWIGPLAGFSSDVVACALVVLATRSHRTGIAGVYKTFRVPTWREHIDAIIAKEKARRETDQPFFVDRDAA